LELPLVVLSSISVTLNVVLIWLYARSEREKAASAAAERTATERLIQARKDGYEVPIAPELPPAPPEPETPFIPELEALVNEWESEHGKEAQRAVIRRLLATGKSQMEVLKYLVPSTSALAAE
jgi:hypothetical protein